MDDLIRSTATAPRAAVAKRMISHVLGLGFGAGGFTGGGGRGATAGSGAPAFGSPLAAAMAGKGGRGRGAGVAACTGEVLHAALVAKVCPAVGATRAGADVVAVVAPCVHNSSAAPGANLVGVKHAIA